MPAPHFYPDPSDPSPVFMFGHFDLDDTDPGSFVALGEALLSVHRKAGRDLAPESSLPRRLNRSVASWFRTVRRR